MYDSEDFAWLETKIPKLANHKFSWRNSCAAQMIPMPFGHRFGNGKGNHIQEGWNLIGYCDNIPTELKKDDYEAETSVLLMFEREDGSERGWFHWHKQYEIRGI